jgi:hypothetical protein
MMPRGGPTHPPELRNTVPRGGPTHPPGIAERWHRNLYHSWQRNETLGWRTRASPQGSWHANMETAESRPEWPFTPHGEHWYAEKADAEHPPLQRWSDFQQSLPERTMALPPGLVTVDIRDAPDAGAAVERSLAALGRNRRGGCLSHFFTALKWVTHGSRCQSRNMTPPPSPSSRQGRGGYPAERSYAAAL